MIKKGSRVWIGDKYCFVQKEVTLKDRDKEEYKTIANITKYFEVTWLAKGRVEKDVFPIDLMTEERPQIKTIKS